MFIKRSIEPIILYLLIDFKGNVIKFIKITRKTSRVINNISSLEIENFLFNQQLQILNPKILLKIVIIISKEITNNKNLK